MLDKGSSTRTGARVGFFLGVVLGALYSIGGFVLDLFVTLGWVTSSDTPGLSYGTVLAFGALIVLPLLCTLFGLISGMVFHLIKEKFLH